MPTGDDLLQRFRRFQERAVLSAPAPPAVQPVASGWEEHANPIGVVYLRQEVRSLTVAPDLDPTWVRRLSSLDLGPPTGWLFFDLETTGLSGGAGTRAFLVGVGRFTGDGFAITQWLLPDLDQEPALLWEVRQAFTQAAAIVSFNGRSYDGPLLRDRLLLAAMDPLPPLSHWDLLHPARRLWSRTVAAGCTLRRLEETVLGHPRLDDIPGEWIPSLYQCYLQGDPSAIAPVTRHNAQDLWALAALSMAFVQTLAEGPRADSSAQLLWGLAQSYERARVPERALACYLACRDRADATTARHALLAATRLLKRMGRGAEALPLWEEARRGPFGSVDAAIELAKHLEHRQNDPAAALEVVRETSGRSWIGPAHRADLERRRARLERRLKARGDQKGGASPRL